MGKVKVNIKKISELSGFSPATVSNVLNRKKGVNKDTVEKIMRIAKEAGYLCERKIESIRLVVYKKNGVIISDSPFFSSLIEGVEKEGRACGYNTEICNLTKDSEDFEELLKEVLADHTSAVLLLATELDEDDVEIFKSATSPVVVLDSWFENMGFDSVLINNTDSVCMAVSYLIDKGHREIGYLKSSLKIQNFYYREQGYKRALERAGISPDEELFVKLFPTMDGAYRDMCDFLEKKPKLPTAYFADNDIIAFGAMKALKEYGFDIPGDVSIIGFDDMPFCEISSPPLTTIRVFKQEMGRMAVRQLVNNIKSESCTKAKIQICTEFVERESVKSI